MLNQERVALLETLDLKLGSHKSFEKGVCALEAVAWLAGEEHSDRPQCTCPVIAGVVRAWNDSLPNDESRNRLIRPLLTKMVGTRITGDAKKSDSVLLKRMFLVQDWHVRTRAVAFLRLAKLETHAKTLEELPEVVDLATLTACTEAASAAWSAAWSAARSAAWSAAWSAARSAAWSAAESAAWSAAESAAEQALAPTVKELQDSFVQVILRMCEVTE